MSNNQGSGGWDEPTHALPRIPQQGGPGAGQGGNQGNQGQPPYGGQQGGPNYGGQPNQGQPNYGDQQGRPGYGQPNQGGQQGRPGYGAPQGQPGGQYGGQPSGPGGQYGGQPQYGNQQGGQYGGYGPLGYAGQSGATTDTRSASGLGKTLGWVLLALGLLLALVTFGTWASANMKTSTGAYNLDISYSINGFGSESYDGLPAGASEPEESNEGRDPFGLPILLMGLGIAAMGVLRGLGKGGRVGGIVAAGLGALATLLALLDWSEVKDDMDKLKETSMSGAQVDISTGWGLWAALLLGLATIAVGVVSALKR